MLDTSAEHPSTSVDVRKIRRAISILERHLGVPEQNRKNPRPDPLDMLVATILSQNTNDTNSYRAFGNLKKRFPDYELILRTPRISLESTIRSGGMAAQKSRRIRELLVELRKRYGSVSLDRYTKMDTGDIFADLISMNGVGVKTASCVLLFSLGREIFPVDTHVHRILNRLGIVSTTSPEKTFYVAGKHIPEGKAYSFHTNLIRFGRSICRSKKPLCGSCPLGKICTYPEKNLSATIDGSTGSMNSGKRDFMLLDHVSR